MNMKLRFDGEKLEKICRKYGVEFLGVFGSTARGEVRPDSDMDILVRFSPDSHGGYFKLVEVEDLLSQKLGWRVDLVTQGALSPYIKDRVYSDLKVIYGRP